MTMHPTCPVGARKTHSHFGFDFIFCAFILVLTALGRPSFAQVTLSAQSQSSTPASGAPITLTLQDALQRARLNDPQYRSAVTDLGLAREDRVQARAGLLPNLNYNNSFIYTQGTGPLPANCASNPVGCPTT